MTTSGLSAFAALTVAIASGIPPTSCVAAEAGVVFQAAPAPKPPSYSDTAAIEEPASGQYVYSARPSPPRPQARFAIGKAARSDFIIYSAEEQEELLALRKRLSAATSAGTVQPEGAHVAAKRIRSVGRHPAARVCAPASGPNPVEAVEWPKVIRDGAKVCVPEPEFADKANWREHVLCFNKGDGSVR